MAIIHLLDDADMPTDVLALAREVERQYGFIPNILRGVANCPELFAPFVRYWGGVYHSPAIGPRLRAFVALGVAFSQECEYCVGPMTQSALAAGLTIAEIQRLQSRQLAHFTSKEQLAYRFSCRLTLDPAGIDAVMRGELRAAFTDAELVNLALAVGTYNMTGRFLKALDIDVDESVTVRPDAISQPA